MRYNRALDLMASALDLARKGKMVTAAKHFEAAIKCESAAKALAIIESSNSKAYFKLLSSSRTLRLEAGDIDSKPKSGVADQNPGAELKVQPDENGDRVVQEAEFDDLEDEDEDEKVESAADEDEDEDEVDASATTAKVKTTANASFARALKNLNALSK